MAVVEIKTGDTYEASWYILSGGVVKEIEFGKLQPNRRKKEGYTTAYKITVANVEERFIDEWKTFRAVRNIRYFASARRKLKRMVDSVKRRR